MKKLAIYGMGGFGREVACLVDFINNNDPTWDLIGFFDDGKQKGASCEYGSVIGDIDDLNKFTDSISIAIAVAKPQYLKKIVKSITNNKVDFPTLISPDTVIFDKNNIKIGKGNIITVGCVLSCNVEIGNFNVFNGLISVGHDTRIGNYNSLMTAIRIAGECSIGNENFFGSSSVVLQQIKIGDNTVIGANSTIMRNTKDGYTYIGTPAIKVKY